MTLVPLFGMADLVDAVALGALTGGGAGGIVSAQQPRRAESLHYGLDAARA